MKFILKLCRPPKGKLMVMEVHVTEGLSYLQGLGNTFQAENWKINASY